MSAGGEERGGLPVLVCAGAQQWRDWLAAHPDQAAGVWLVHAKKGSGLTTVSYAEAVDEALCAGWIDGKLNTRDEQTYCIRYTPRRPRSVWSQVNREHVARLVAAGRLLPAGLAAVEAAQADGRWDRAYAPASRAAVPDDLQAALDASPAAADAFAGLSGGVRYAVLYRLQDAKRAETRARRLQQFVERLQRGESPV